MKKAAIVIIAVLCAVFLFGRGSAPGPTPAPDSWTSIGPDGGSIAGLVRNPKNSSELYAVTRGYPGCVYRSANGGADSKTLYKSTDGGKNWTQFSGAFPGNATKILVLGNTLHVASSAGGGQNWSQIKIRDENKSGADAGIIDPSDGNTIYLSGHTAAWTPVLYKSGDAGASWTEISVPKLPASSSTSQIQALAVDPKSSNRVYAGTAWSGVYVSTNGGGAWTQLGGNAPWSAECIAVNASNPNELFIGNNGGFFYSKNTGASWTDLWRDLPAKSVLSIHIDGSARKVYVGTQGGGICRRSF
jgi:photosystem II stability/assembly factor-like uncharacterized protein